MRSARINAATLVVTLTAGAGFAAGQSGARQGPTPAPAARPAASATDTQTFVNEMANAGMAEVQLGKLATERAAHADVKAFGQMMVTDHTMAGNELKAAASRQNLTLPAQLDQKHRDLVAKLSKLSGAEFDREYMMAMVQGHEDVAAKLRARADMSRAPTSTARPTESSPSTPGATSAGGTRARGDGPSSSAPAQATATSGASDSDVTGWAAKTLPKVEQHLMRARELQRTVK